MNIVSSNLSLSLYLPEVDDVSRPPVLLVLVLDDVRVPAEEHAVHLLADGDEGHVLHAEHLLGAGGVVGHEADRGAGRSVT